MLPLVLPDVLLEQAFTMPLNLRRILTLEREQQSDMAKARLPETLPRIRCHWEVLPSRIRLSVGLYRNLPDFRDSAHACPLVKGDRVTENLVNDDSSGIMGLAFERLAGTESTPFWQALAEGGELTSKEMSFWLARSGIDQTSQTDVRFGGVFTLGGTNSSLFSGDIEFLDLVGEPAFWTLDLKGKPMMYDIHLVLAFLT